MLQSEVNNNLDVVDIICIKYMKYVPNIYFCYLDSSYW